MQGIMDTLLFIIRNIRLSLIDGTCPSLVRCIKTPNLPAGSKRAF
jgi:hypothetical protein